MQETNENGTDANNLTEPSPVHEQPTPQSMVILANILHPYYCMEIACPLFTERKCEICQLREMLSSFEGEIPGNSDDATIEYDPDTVPCTLGNLSEITYKEWLEMPNPMFKKNANRAIMLIVDEYKNGTMIKPLIKITNVEGSKMSYDVTQYCDDNCSYGQVASEIYKKMGSLIPRAQLKESQCSSETGSSVTQSIAYLIDARIQFLKEVESFCARRYTEDVIQQEARRLMPQWIENRKREEQARQREAQKREERRIRAEQEQAARKKQELELAEKINSQCVSANLRYGTKFDYEQKAKKVYIRHSSIEEEKEYEKRLVDVKYRLESLNGAEWIKLQCYSNNTGIIGMCDSVREFKETYSELWAARSREKTKPGSMRGHSVLLAYVPEIYNDFVHVTDNYPSILMEEEKRREKEMEDPLPIIDRDKLPA